MEEEDYDRIFADAWKRLIVTMPGRAICEIASDDHDAKGERLRHLVEKALQQPPGKRELTRALGLAWEIVSVVNYYANEGSGGAETVSEDLEGELQAVDADEVEQHLITEIGEMLALLGRKWQVERRFPGYGWRLEESARMVLTALAVLRAKREVLP